MTFESYLQQALYSPSTITYYLHRLGQFTSWAKHYGTSPKTIDYKTLLHYLKHLQTNNQVQTVNNHIATLKQYFNYLMTQGNRVDNPLEDTIIKGTIKKVYHNLLTSDELEDLYYSYNTEIFNKYTPKKQVQTIKRNKMIVGLLVYQGLNTTQLKHLRLEHLDLYKGTIYIPSTKRSNARTLALKTWQVMDGIAYLNETRPILLKNNTLEADCLFIPQKHFNDLIHMQVLKPLKRINAKVTNVNDLRASVIVNWLKQYNIRKVQYLAGHKYISSTERYKQDDLESLQKAVDNYHPLQ